MKNNLHIYLKTLTTVFLALCYTFSVRAQYMGYYDSTYVKYPKQLKDTVLMNTDHFYFGGETGFGFNVGPTVTTQPGARFETNSAPFDLYDFSMTAPTKLYVGYAYKNHHFEGTVGMMREKVNISILDAAGYRAVDYRRSQTYGAVTLRYFYRFPMRIPRLKLMMGAEVGATFRPDNMQEHAYTLVRDSGYTLNTYSENNNFKLLLGISSRMDIKLCKNVSLILLATVIGSPLRGTEYTFYYTYQGSTNQTAQVYATLLNINLNAGLKFEFFSHKKKNQTYNRYGIHDPFRDK